MRNDRNRESLAERADRQARSQIRKFSLTRYGEWFGQTKYGQQINQFIAPVTSRIQQFTNRLREISQGLQNTLGITRTTASAGEAVARSGAVKAMQAAASRISMIAAKVLGPLLKAIGSALTGPLGLAVAAATLINPRDVAKGAISTGAAIASVAGTVVTQTVSSAAATAGISVLILAPTVAIIMFIINSGAYIVPIATDEAYIPDARTGACFKLVGPGVSADRFISRCAETWPAQASQTIAAATVKMEEQPGYIEKLCANGDINLYYSSSPDCVAVAGLTRNSNEILFGPRAIQSPTSAFFTLAHESGHVLAGRTNLQQIYGQTTNLRTELNLGLPEKEGIICTYPFNTNPPPPTGDGYFYDEVNGVYIKSMIRMISESFAEMIAHYYNTGGPCSGSRNCSCFRERSGTLYFEDAYPRHWQFAKDVIFQ